MINSNLNTCDNILIYFSIMCMMLHMSKILYDPIVSELEAQYEQLNSNLGLKIVAEEDKYFPRRWTNNCYLESLIDEDENFKEFNNI